MLPLLRLAASPEIIEFSHRRAQSLAGEVIEVFVFSLGKSLSAVATERPFENLDGPE